MLNKLKLYIPHHLFSGILLGHIKPWRWDLHIVSKHQKFK